MALRLFYSHKNLIIYQPSLAVGCCNSSC